jgi:hypothetical protein
LGGDLTNFGTPNAVEDLIRRAWAVCPHLLAVAGNCDSAAIDLRLAELGVSLCGRGVERDGIGFYGVSAMPPWRGKMYELTEAEIAAAIRCGRSQLRDARQEVLLTHTPPRDTVLDRTKFGEHVGSTAVREFIDRHQPALVVCGHIHESRGIAWLGATCVVNCGPAFDGHYALIEIADTIRAELCTLDSARARTPR